ncbi:hypothetical protein ACQRIT_005790 [Beauveria bassiana]
MAPIADLRIASKYAYYDNHKNHGESLTIVLYIYNAGPDSAASPVVTAGYTTSMDHGKWQATARHASISSQPLEQVLANSNTLWADVEIAERDQDDNKQTTITTLPTMHAGTVVELSLSFPMTHYTSHTDDTLKAHVHSTTTDPRYENNGTSYIVTPNHHDDGEEYWKSPGNLANLN